MLAPPYACGQQIRMRLLARDKWRDSLADKWSSFAVGRGSPVAGSSKTVPKFARPYDTSAIDEAISARGAAVLRQAFSPQMCDRFVTEVNDYLDRNPERRKRA